MYVGIMTIAQDIIKPFVVPLPWIFEPTKINEYSQKTKDCYKKIISFKECVDWWK